MKWAVTEPELDSNALRRIFPGCYVDDETARENERQRERERKAQRAYNRSTLEGSVGQGVKLPKVTS